MQFPIWGLITTETNEIVRKAWKASLEEGKYGNFQLSDILTQTEIVKIWKQDQIWIVEIIGRYRYHIWLYKGTIYQMEIV